MTALLRSLIHDRVVMTVIVLNAVAAFLHAFQSFPALIRDGLYWIDYGCAVFFVIEIATKVSFRGWSSFWVDGWNRFDFIVVALSLPYLLSPTALFSLEGLGAILLLRLGRLLRLLRLVHFIPNQEEIQQGIARALRASVGVFFALFLYTFTLTLFSYSLFHGHAPQYFGDPLTALYSMFQIFTVEGWYEIPNHIAQQSGWAVGGFARVYFAFTVLTGGIIGLSLANAVFVDEMVIDNTRDLEDDVDAIQENLKAHMRQSQEKRRELKTMIAELHEHLQTEESDQPK